ncbi:MAG: hypothetical protein IKQ45_00490 [Clostridia bacterium]|nr:hypothetical protein [Clostridia bacterium]
MPFLSDYEQRTVWKYEPIHGSFHTHEGLGRKVNPDGSYAPFHGSTVAFRPGKKCFRIIRLMMSVLYQKLDGTGMLAIPLPDDAIHMTLHDLVSPEMCSSYPAEAYDPEVVQSIDRAAGIVEDIRKEYAGRKITMVSDRIVSMVAKSVVLMLRPQTEEDFELLMELYRRFDEIQSLPYPLTPHITLAYFKPGMIDGDTLGEAVEFAQIDPEKAPVFAFFPEALTAQSFLDMQSYLDIPARICFCCDGGLNRSVMAAQILNYLARERHLPVIGEARAAYPSTQGWPVREQVWNTLESHGIRPDRTYSSAKYLQDDEAALFSSLVGISGGAMDRIARLGLPEERVYHASRFFFGVRDPEYGEITHEQAFADLYCRAEKYLDDFETVYRKHVRK